MYNGHRSDRQWSRLERQLSLPSASPQSATQMVYDGKDHPKNFAPVGDVAQVADFDRRRSGGHKQTIDSYQMSSNFQTTAPPGSRNLLVDQRGRYQHCTPSNQPSTLTEAAYVRRNESVEILRHVSSEFTSRRPRSEMYPTTKASVGDASNFASGCCSECRGSSELLTGRWRSGESELKVNDDVSCDNGYVINGRGPLTMTSAAVATNCRSTMLLDARMVEAVDSLSSASRSDFDDVSHRRLQPQSSPAHRLSYQCPPDGVSIGTGTSDWRPGGPVEMRRKLKSGDGKFSADCQPVLPRAPQATSASVGLRSVDNFNTALRDVTSKSSFKNGFHVVGANDTRVHVLGSNSTSALTTEQHLNHCDVNAGGLDTSFNDTANDYRNYQNSDWSRWSRDNGPLSEVSISGRPTSCGVDGSKGSVRFGVSAGDRSPLKPALPSASALRHVVERHSLDSVQRQTQRGFHHSDNDFGFHDDWTAISNGMLHHEAISNVASNLKAHSLSLSHSQSNNIVADPTGNHLRRGQQSVSSVSLSSSASSGSGLQLKRRLKTIVETLDVLTSVGNRKSMLSSPTAAAVTGQQGNTRRIRVKLQRSNSDPEGLDRINNDDAEFGFSGNSIPHLRALQDDCALNRRTGNVLAPSPTTTMSSGSHSADERNRDFTSTRASGVSSTSKPSISKKLWGSKKVQSPGGTGRNSEPCSPLNSSAASCPTAFDRDGYDVTMPIRNPPSSILDLTDEEHTVLQKISISKLNTLGELNGCSVVIPKGGVTEASGGRPISSKFSQLKKYVSSSAAFSDNGKHVVIDSPGKDKSTGGGKGLVFGIPLDKVLANEAAEVNSSTGVDLKSSSSDDNLVDALSLSLNESLSNRYRSTSSLNSLSNHRGTSSQQQHSMVPYVVRTCCQFLQMHGRHVPGIFRVTGAKSRVNMLRQEFDSGGQVRLSEEQHVVHDVASLLKEFIRDLPDPLLTRDLYTAFLATTSIDDVNRRVSVLRLLVSLLPPANRDTLWTLLSFLGVLAKHSDDTVDEKGQLLPGNKMDSSNLATVFGPNLLSKSKTGKLQVDGLEQMSHNAEIVAVTKDLIDFHSAIFRLTKELYNDIIHSTVTRLPSHVTSVGQSQSSCTSSSSVQHDANVTIKIYPPDFSTASVSMTTRSLASDDSTHSASGVKLNSTTEYDLSERHSLLPLKNNQNSPRHSVAGSDRTSSSSSSFGGLNAPHHVERSSSPVSSSGTAATSESVLNTASHVNGDVTRQAIGDWQIQRWRHWERLADQSKRQASEQQTLV